MTAKKRGVPWDQDHAIARLHLGEYSRGCVKLNWSVNRRVESCSRCEGTGYTCSDELSDYHKREYRTVQEACKVCAGCGRVTVTTTTSYLETNYGATREGSTVLVESVPWTDLPVEGRSAYVDGGYLSIPLGDLMIKEAKK